MSRVYRIKCKSDDQYIVGTTYKKIGRRKYEYIAVYSDEPKYFDAPSLNWLIRILVVNNISDQLDNVEIEAFEIPDPLPYIPVKSGLKVQTLRKRFEAELIVQKLKNQVFL